MFLISAIKPNVIEKKFKAYFIFYAFVKGGRKSKALKKSVMFVSGYKTIIQIRKEIRKVLIILHIFYITVFKTFSTKTLLINFVQ